MSIAILSVGRDPQLLNTRNRFLETAGFTIVSCTTMPQIINTVFEENFNAALLCNSIQGEDRRMLAGIIRRYYPAVPVILISDSEKSTQTDGCWLTSGDLNNIIATVHRALQRPEVEKASISSRAA